MHEMSETINAILWLVVAILALITFIIFYISYRRVKNKKILITTIAFLLFFVKAIVLGMRLFVPDDDSMPWYMDDEFWWSIAAVLDAVIIGLIVYSLSKRANDT
jgi:amino acid transporter